MLKTLRKKGVAKKILWIITFFIILSFVMWGKYSVIQDQGRINYAGKVFGKKISIEQYQRSLGMTRVQAMMQYGQDYVKVSEFLNLQAQTWDRIILLQEAQRRGIKASDAEVVKTIESYPLFQRDGKLDPLRYNDLLRYVFRVTPHDFEEGIRETLQISKLIIQESVDLTITPEDAFNIYKKQKEKIQISYALFPDDNYKNEVAFDEQKGQAYYKNNSDAFTVPLMINVDYVRFDVPPVDKKDKPDAGKKTTATESTEEAAPSPEVQQQKSAALEKSMNFLKEAEQTKNFGQTAKNYKIAVEQSGLFSMEQPILKSGWSFPVVQKLFDLNVDDLKGPVETPDGYQVLKIKEKKASYTPPYEEVRDKVKEALLKTEAHKISKQKAEEYLPQIREQYKAVKNPDFAQIVKDLKLQLEQTPVFGRGQYLPKIGVSRDFQDRAFGLNDKSKISKVVETVKGYCILHLDSRTQATREEFEKEKEKFTAEVLEQKKNEVVSDFVTRMRLKSNLEDHVAQLMK